MVKTFGDKETEKIFKREGSRKLPEAILKAAERKLAMLNAASVLDSLRIPPANRLERLKGDRAGAYSLRINGQWRLTFEWVDGDAYNVRIEDYHK